MSAARITVHVTPRSGADSIESGAGGDVHVRVTSPPDEGKANAAVCRVVATALGVPKTSVHVVRGHRARIKSLEVDGLTDEEARAAIARLAR